MNRLVSESEYVITMLVNRMIPPERERRSWPDRPEERRENGAVFLLGAGCSRQYGLPSFRELLTYIWQDCFYSPPDRAWSFEMLRDQLNKYWQAQGPEARLKLLKHYLDRVDGRICSGYVRLTSLVRDGVIKAIVNMNFDTLLEDALRAQDQEFSVSTSFNVPDEGQFMIYKPHGSIGGISPCGGKRKEDTPANELILDIANSDLFATPIEQECAQRLLTRHDVVSVGYSGVDAKIAAALRGFAPSDNPKDKKLFVANLSRPDPRLLLAMAERSSQDLSITGGEAVFENFMEQLWVAVRTAVDRRPVLARYPAIRSAADDPNFMTAPEHVALAECLRLALSLRSAINVADQSSVGIEEHGRQVYRICLDLADAAGVCLTSPEKYLLHCTAYLHDLGYFEAFSGSNKRDGYWLLKNHGKMSACLIRQRLQVDEALAERIVPRSYERGRRQFREILYALCRHHAAQEIPGRMMIDDMNVDIAGIPVPVRFELLQSLFSCAELIINEHPFLPSSDPVVARNESRWAIEDPVLDLYLRRKKDEVSFTIERGKVVGRFLGQAKYSRPSRKALWLLAMTAESVRRFSLLSSRPEYRGWGVEFTCSPQQVLPVRRSKESLDHFFTNLLRQALGEALHESLEQVRRDSEREVAALLERASVAASEVRGRMEVARPELAQALGIVERWLGWVCACLRERWIGDLARSLEFVQKALDQFQAELQGDSAHDCQVLLTSLGKGLDQFKVNVRDLASDQVLREVRGARDLLQKIRGSLGPASLDEAGELDRVVRLIEQFESNVQKDFPGDLASLADLVAIYTRSIDGREPRVSMVESAGVAGGSEVVAIDQVVRRLDAAQRSGRLPHEALLPLYLKLKRQRTARTAMERLFLGSFEDRIYPAWRFLARNWNDHIESVLMARACLDLGSSRFRGEVVSGLRHLLDDKVCWHRTVAFGHEQCTVCTSRLLYIFSHARRLFPREELKGFETIGRRKGLDETVGGLLRHMLSLSPDDKAWWGLGAQNRKGSVHSPDYLAWSARSVAFCLAVDHEVRDKTGEEWLEDHCRVRREEVERLLRERWQLLYRETAEDLLNDCGEEPHSYILGRVALACLDLQWLDDRVRSQVGNEEQAQVFRHELDKACRMLSQVPLAQLSRFYLWPAILYLDRPDRQSERSREAVDLCYRCVHSPVWIESGADAGSWGSNVKNSQAVVTSLTAFWRFAFQPESRPVFERIFKEREEDVPGVDLTAPRLQPTAPAAAP